MEPDLRNVPDSLRIGPAHFDADNLYFQLVAARVAGPVETVPVTVPKAMFRQEAAR